MFQDVIKNQQSIVNDTVAIKAQITKNQSKDSKTCLKMPKQGNQKRRTDNTMAKT